MSGTTVTGFWRMSAIELAGATGRGQHIVAFRLLATRHAQSYYEYNVLPWLRD